MSSSRSLDERLGLIETRLRQIEDAIGLFKPEALQPNSEPESKPQALEPKPGLPAPSPETAAPVPAAEPKAGVLDLTPLIVREREADAEPEPPAPTPPVAPPIIRERPKTAPKPASSSPPSSPTPSPTTSPTPSNWSWEQLIGGRLFAAVGALVVLTGLGLFLKLAYDLGWIGMLSPGMKCGAGVLFGAALLSVGELARRRWNALASAGFSATGLGALYASAFAAYSVYQLLPVQLAFVTLALVSALGIGIALRAGLVSIACLSILGAYTTPLLLHSPDSPPMVLPIYLMALTALGLFLSGAHVRFRVLRSLVWWGTALLGGVWALARSEQAPATSIGFCALVWLSFHAELLWSARRGALSEGRSVRDAARPLIVSLGTTCWSVLLGAYAIARTDSGNLWMAPGAAMIATFVLATILSGHLRVLRDPPRNDEERLGAVLLVQSAALLIAALAMGVTTEWLQIVCWLVFGVASIVGGRWVGSRALDIYGLIVLSIGTARLVLIDTWLGNMRTGGAEVWGLVLTEWSLMSAIAGVCWLAAGRLLLIRALGDRPLSRLPVACAGLGVIALLATVLHADARATSLAVVWASMTLPLAALHAYERRLALDALSLIPLAMGFVAWWIGFIVPGWEASSAGAPVHPGLLTGLLIVGVCLAAAWWHAKHKTTFAKSWHVLAPCAVVLFLVPTTLEIARQVGFATDAKGAKPDAMALWWAICGTIAVFVGTASKAKPVWVTGFVLIGMAVLLWPLGYPVEGWIDHTRSVWLHPGAISGLSIAGLTILSAWWHNRSTRDAPGSQEIFLSMLGAGALLFLFTTTLEVARQAGALSEAAGTRTNAVALWWALCAVVGVFVGARRTFQPVWMSGLCLGAVAGVLWLIGYPIQGWDDSSGGGAIHPGMVTAGLMVAMLGTLAPLVRRRGEAVLTWTPLVIAILLLFASTSLEIARLIEGVTDIEAARGGAVSIWWGLFALALLVWGGLAQVKGMRWAGLALLAVATTKAVILDLAGVDPAWRVASFLALGLLLLGVGAGYMRRIDRKPPDSGSSGEPVST